MMRMAGPRVVACPAHPNPIARDYLNCIQKATTVKPPDGRLPNTAANTLGLYCMLKGGSKNEEWGRANVIRGGPCERIKKMRLPKSFCY